VALVDKESIKDKIFSVLIWGFIGMGLLLAAYGINIPYSYWWDELYSVAGASSKMGVMFSDLIMPDVHPPLYQLVLKGWILIFSNSEISARLLSLLFALCAFAVIAAWGRKRLSKIGFLSMLAVFSTNCLFIYYSQEARSYAMMLFFATFVTVLFVEVLCGEGGQKVLYGLTAACLTLSLTHYFGLVYSGVILMYLLVREIRLKNFKNSMLISATGIFCLFWPAFHYFFGGIGQKMGGDFWIKSDGWQTTLETASLAVFPQIMHGWDKIFSILNQYVVAVSFVALLFLIGFLACAKTGFLKEARDNPMGKGLLVVLAAFLAAVMLIDLKSPISTARNFIVILPMVSILCAVAAERFFHFNRAVLYVLVVLLAATNIGGFMSAYSKWSGRLTRQNHKEATEYIVQCMGEQDYNLYYWDRRGSLSKMHEAMARFYIDKAIGGENIEVGKFTVEELSSLEKPYLLFIQHSEEAYNRVAEVLDNSGVAFDAYLPEQRNEGALVIKVE